MTPADPILAAARAIRDADALLITAGAGMGVDSGLPDFRGPEGFWRAYPPYRALGLSFADLACPDTFRRDPALAWGFYGHRLNLYRTTVPHVGFGVLRKWAGRTAHGHFVFTSNVDGQFERAGFDAERIEECHGTIHYMQCASVCCEEIWPADNVTITIDESTMRAVDPLPTCPHCGGLARPNILMFGDGAWIETRTGEQAERLQAWLMDLRDARAKIAIVECGAGTAIPTVRYHSEHVALQLRGTLIRINVREPHGPPGTISIATGAREALERIDAVLTSE
ncbi:MAG TPA: Sir2 family NAD-dependent protein deacetylase [Tepidisphaeraceae bacterium]|nr:Sir2 family NAD-dependent protein deacetylase [Tepidisphaeraceae bacterium]